MSDEPRPPRDAGYRMSELCAREGIDRRTGWRWASKGLLEVTRRAPRTGVRVHYPRQDDPDDDDD